MASNLPEPKSRKESYLAKAAGMGVTIPEKPESREEQYLAAIAEGGGGGGGGSYTAGDGIVIDNDEISVDLAQTTGASTSSVMSQKAVSDALASAGGGGAKELTSADFNWNLNLNSATEPYDCVALWLLEPGTYYKTATSGLPVAFQSNPGGITTIGTGTYIVNYITENTKQILFTHSNSTRIWYEAFVSTPSGFRNGNVNTFLMSDSIVQTTGNSTTNIMSQKAVTDALAGAGGGVTILTSADYNYHSSGDTDDGIAVWKLNRGYYKITDNGPIKVYWTSTISENVSSVIFIIGHTNYGGTTGKRQVIRAGAYSVIGTDVLGGFYIWTVTSSGTSSDYNIVNKNGYTITGSNITSIAGSSENEIMSQKAVTSMVFADPSTQKQVKIGYRTTVGSNKNTAVGESATAAGTNSVAIGSNAWTNASETVAIGDGAIAQNIGTTAIGRNASTGTTTYSVALGHHAVTTRNGEVNVGTGSTPIGYNSTNYRVIGGVHDPVDSHDAATKGYVDANAGGPTVVQTTGTSTTNVMSQNATTGMVYDDTAGFRVKIGSSSSASGAVSTAIGKSSQASYGGSIALGAYSSTSQIGEMNIGSSDSSVGYNNTNYRLLSGVHDGQTAHDAVTVEQVNATIDAINTALSTNIPHIGLAS